MIIQKWVLFLSVINSSDLGGVLRGCFKPFLQKRVNYPFFEGGGDFSFFSESYSEHLGRIPRNHSTRISRKKRGGVSDGDLLDQK